MADPKQPIRSDNGVVVPLERWAEELADRAAERAVARHQEDCPAFAALADHEERLRAQEQASPNGSALKRYGFPVGLVAVVALLSNLKDIITLLKGG